MGDGAVSLVGDAYVEETGHGREAVFAGDGEIPMGEGFGGFAADVGCAVAAEAGWGVTDGVKAGAEEVCFGEEAWAGGEGFLKDSEVAGDAGAEIGQRAAGVDEGDEQGLAFELGEMDGVAILVGEAEVGDFVAGLGDVELDCGAIIRLGLADDDEVIDKYIGIGGLGDEHVGGDHIAGVQFAENAVVAQFVGHGHRFHEAGDGLMVDGDFALGGVGGNYFAAQGIGFELLWFAACVVRGGRFVTG